MEKKKTSTKKPSTANKKRNVTKVAKKAPAKKAQVKKTTTVQQQKNTTKKTALTEKNANTGLLLGIASITALVMPALGLLIAVLGFYCGCSGLASKRIQFATIALALCVFFLQIAIWNTMTIGLLG